MRHETGNGKRETGNGKQEAGIMMRSLFGGMAGKGDGDGHQLASLFRGSLFPFPCSLFRGSLFPFP
jgi:hypothetical protein